MASKCSTATGHGLSSGNSGKKCPTGVTWPTPAKAPCTTAAPPSTSRSSISTASNSTWVRLLIFLAKKPIILIPTCPKLYWIEGRCSKPLWNATASRPPRRSGGIMRISGKIMHCLILSGIVPEGSVGESVRYVSCQRKK